MTKVFDNRLTDVNKYKRQLAIIKLGIGDSVRIDSSGGETVLKNDLPVTLSAKDETDIANETTK